MQLRHFIILHFSKFGWKVGGKDNNIRRTSWCCHSLSECAETLIDVVHTQWEWWISKYKMYVGRVILQMSTTKIFNVMRQFLIIFIPFSNKRIFRIHFRCGFTIHHDIIGLPFALRIAYLNTRRIYKARIFSFLFLLLGSQDPVLLKNRLCINVISIFSAWQKPLASSSSTTHKFEPNTWQNI